MAEQYMRGIADSGADVLDIGMVGTEMLYWTVGSRDLDGGLMCTASHNPKGYTGAKLVKRGALALSGDSGIGELKELVGEGDPGPPVDDPGQTSTDDIGDEFRRAALGYIDPKAVKPMKVMLDGGNGMAGPMAGPILDDFPLDQERAYWEPNGDFPDHEPNPLIEENRRFIVDKVKETGADLGIAWDGDADRCFFIDDTGEFVAGDFLTALLAQSILRKDPGAAILYDVRASRAVPDAVERAGGHAHINRVGHAFFKTRMRELGAAFGGEVSGHYYFHDFYCADSGTIPALLILELLSVERRSSQSCSQALPVAVLHFRRDQLRSPGPGGQDEGDRGGALLGRAGQRPRRRLDRLRRLALQRAPVEHRAAPAPEPRVARLARAHEGEAGRGARRHPRVKDGIHRIPISTPFAVAVSRSGCTNSRKKGRRPAVIGMRSRPSDRGGAACR